jgi:acetyl esterase/lipase
VLLTAAGSGDAVARAVCARDGVVVLSAALRPAPPPSTPEEEAVDVVEDAVTVTGWAADHAAELGADPGRLLVGGEGGGAALAAAVAARARDAGWPPIDLVGLVDLADLAHSADLADLADLAHSADDADPGPSPASPGSDRR